MRPPILLILLSIQTHYCLPQCKMIDNVIRSDAIPWLLNSLYNQKGSSVNSIRKEYPDLRTCVTFTWCLVKVYNNQTILPRSRHLPLIIQDYLKGYSPNCCMNAYIFIFNIQLQSEETDGLLISISICFIIFVSGAS